MRKGLVIVLSGPAGSGKDTVLDAYFAAGGSARKTVSMTTRAPRRGEKNGVDYYFTGRDEFLSAVKAGKLLEYTEYSGSFYGTPLDEVRRITAEGSDVILKIEVEGGMNLRKAFPDAVLVFLMPPSRRVLEQRLRKRATEDEETLRRRLARAQEEIVIAREVYDYLVVNDTVAEAAARLSDIICAERMRISRNGEFFEEVKNNG